MKYAFILTLVASSSVLISCEKNNNEEGTAAPNLEKSVQTAEARFAADMVGIPLGKYVPVSEASKIPPGKTVYTKGTVLRKSAPSDGQDDVILISDSEKIKASIINGEVKIDENTKPEDFVSNTILAHLPQESGKMPVFEELDEVLIIGTMEPNEEKNPVPMIKVKAIGKTPKADSK